MTAARDALREYRQKRDFRKTSEPRGAVRGARSYAYAIQKHAARRLHYDLRLALDGVLKSWAVTRGPSLDPADRRLAVRTEDHPFEYGSFEGTIAEGEYGAGGVMLWDRGEWEPIGDPHEGLRKGDLKFRLHGERLKGAWVLVRMKPRHGEKKENWLLIKKRDEYADPAIDVLRRFQTSVTTGREMGDIMQSGATWDTRAGAARAPARDKAAKKAGPQRMPKRVAPQLATLVEEPPEGDEWLHEIKYDGYRMLAAIAGDRVRLYTRSGKDWADRFASLLPGLAALPAASALIDGEVVVFDSRGRSDFASLQQALKQGDGSYVFAAFDLLERDGRNRKEKPLEARKQELHELLQGADGRVIYCEHVVGDGPRVLAQACGLGAEGIMCKRRKSPYRTGRTRTWLKVKCNGHDDFVIGGWRPSSVSGRPFSSLLLGEYVDGSLRYRGRVGTGFDGDELERLGRRLRALRRDTPPFDDVPREIRRQSRWVEPALRAEIGYTERTGDGLLRHPRYLGLREDKETPEPARPARSGAGSVKAEGRVEVAGVTISSPDKVLVPDQGLTKQGLAEYLADIAETMLPYVAGRPLTLLRCPEGSANKCFFQRHAGPGIAGALKTVEIGEASGGRSDYLYLTDRRGLVGTAQMGVLELHVWGARVDALDRPDRLVFDLDPDEAVGFAEVRRAARELADLLKAAGLVSFPLITGGKGIHVVAPLAATQPWEEVKNFAAGLARALTAAQPERFLAKASKAARRGKIFIDWLRNEKGATAIAPYSVRARPGAPVAVPVSWRELSRIDGADRYSMDRVRQRVRSLRADPWPDYFALKQSISKRTLDVVRQAL